MRYHDTNTSSTSNERPTRNLRTTLARGKQEKPFPTEHRHSRARPARRAADAHHRDHHAASCALARLSLALARCSNCARRQLAPLYPRISHLEKSVQPLSLSSLSLSHFIFYAPRTLLALSEISNPQGFLAWDPFGLHAATRSPLHALAQWRKLDLADSIEALRRLRVPPYMLSFNGASLILPTRSRRSRRLLATATTTNTTPRTLSLRRPHHTTRRTTPRPHKAKQT